VSFVKPFTDVIGMSPEKRRNGNMSVGYLGRAALRREQCDMMAEARITGPEKSSIATKQPVNILPQQPKHAPTSTIPRPLLGNSMLNTHHQWRNSWKGCFLCSLCRVYITRTPDESTVTHEMEV
jgi:hypothetical protein